MKGRFRLVYQMCVRAISDSFQRVWECYCAMHKMMKCFLAVIFYIQNLLRETNGVACIWLSG